MKTIHLGEVEADDIIAASHYPKLPYRRALSLWFFLPEGTIYQVRAANNEAFSQFITLCVTGWPKEKQQGLLAGLNEDELLGKWYILNELHLLKMHAPLFQTPEEALAAYRLVRWLNSLLIGVNDVDDFIEEWKAS